MLTCHTSEFKAEFLSGFADLNLVTIEAVINNYADFKQSKVYEFIKAITITDGQENFLITEDLGE